MQALLPSPNFGQGLVGSWLGWPAIIGIVNPLIQSTIGGTILARERKTAESAYRGEPGTGGGAASRGGRY
jgi:hypothetical protein